MDKIPFPAKAWELTKPALVHIAENEARFHMNTWVRTVKSRFEIEDYREDYPDREIPPCGTVACLSGWTGLLAGLPESQCDGHTVLNLMGIGDTYLSGTFVEEAARRLNRIYHMTHIETYAELKTALEDAFTFPEPLPEARSV